MLNGECASVSATLAVSRCTAGAVPPIDRIVDQQLCLGVVHRQIPDDQGERGGVARLHFYFPFRRESSVAMH
jgi:hypothetical protein